MLLLTKASTRPVAKIEFGRMQDPNNWDFKTRKWPFLTPYKF